jgi:hypothetical protein
MDEPKNDLLNFDPRADVAAAKARLRACAYAITEHNPIKRHPLMVVGVALAAGVGAAVSPKTRDSFLKTGNIVLQHIIKNFL